MRRALLALALLAAGGVADAAEAPADALRAAIAAANAAYAAKDWSRAESAWGEAARVARERHAQDPASLDLAAARNELEYNQACSAALAGRADAAYSLLGGVLDREWYDNLDLIGSDPDLEPLRADAPRFAALRARARRLVEEAAAGHVEGRVLLPRRAPRPKAAVPGIVALHGGGGSVEGFEAPWQAVADRTGAVVILVRGSLVQGRGSFSWDQRRPEREAARLDAWIARARALAPALDERELLLAGYSQGGGMAWVLGVTGERAWRGIVPLGGYVQVAVRERVLGEPRQELAAFAVVGEKDEAAIREVNARLASQEGLARLRARLEVVPGLGHALPPDLPSVLQRALRWCRRG